jgi:imidazolonepropionase-like amidohydrolase
MRSAVTTFGQDEWGRQHGRRAGASLAVRGAIVVALLGGLPAFGCARDLASHPPQSDDRGAVESPRAPVDPFAAPEANARTIVDVVVHAPAPPLLLRHATVMTATGKTYAPGYVLMERGEIREVGAGDGPAPKEGTQVLDASGKFVTPGIVDVHSHMGVYPVPETAAHDDGNEMTDPITAGLRAEHSFWPQDPALERAVAGGVTTIGVLPGSANVIGGRGFTVHMFPERGARAMRFPGAPDILKMACGENPKRIYHEQKRAPSTRMGTMRALREAFLKAQKYRRDWEEWSTKESRPKGAKGGDAGADKPPDRDLALETLALVLRGDLLVEWHCYQADDMLAALQVADELGFQVRAFHHALEAYKIRDVLARRHVAVATWDDWWGFKMEAYDGIPENLGLLSEAGVRAAVHSDSSIEVQILNQAAAKALAAARAAGIALDDDAALRWLTIDGAWILGIDDQVGTLEPGKRADVVVWTENPLSTYARAERVYVDGTNVFDRTTWRAPWSDFELGLRAVPTNAPSARPLLAPPAPAKGLP